MNVGRWLKQEVSYRAKTGRDANGMATLAALATLPARVEASERVLRTADGTERVASHVIYTETLLAMGTLVWVPGADTANVGEAREVLQTGSVPRLHHPTDVLCRAILG